VVLVSFGYRGPGSHSHLRIGDLHTASSDAALSSALIHEPRGRGVLGSSSCQARLRHLRYIVHTRRAKEGGCPNEEVIGGAQHADRCARRNGGRRGFQRLPFLRLLLAKDDESHGTRLTPDRAHTPFDDRPEDTPHDEHGTRDNHLY
jgi:hypothetical protein